ncbi:MAG: AAA family ATPase [Succinivibrio sp.]|nr:AAA family ATPase [Succinivibrio sp.]
MCKGNLFENEFGDYVYKEEGSDKAYFLKNLSSGLKTFVLFNTFLQSGVIESGATIIFDEPEIHLHPKWQLEFAKMIVQLQKALNLNILINTHSPYFLYALEVFVKKYGTLESTRYYFAHNEDRCPVIEDVSSDIERIYKTLFAPLQLLENVRDSL